MRQFQWVQKLACWSKQILIYDNWKFFFNFKKVKYFQTWFNSIFKNLQKFVILEGFVHTHKFPRGVSHKTPHCQTPHKKGGRSVLAQLMKFLWISPKTRQLGETFEGWLWFTKPNLPTAPVDQNIWSRFWEWSRQKFTVEPRKYNFSY